MQAEQADVLLHWVARFSPRGSTSLCASFEILETLGLEVATQLFALRKLLSNGTEAIKKHAGQERK